MDRLEFEAELRRDGYRTVNSSVKPNLIAPNHCHDFDAKAFCSVAKSPLPRQRPCDLSPHATFEVPAGCMHAEHLGPKRSPCYRAASRWRALTREAFETTCVARVSTSCTVVNNPTLPRN